MGGHARASPAFPAATPAQQKARRAATTRALVFFLALVLHLPALSAPARGDDHAQLERDAVAALNLTASNEAAALLRPKCESAAG